MTGAAFRLTRRALLAGLAAAMTAAPAGAMTVDGARALIDTVVDEVYRVINSGKPPAEMYRDFAQIFVRHADVATIARSVLGPDARRMSPAQMAAFTRAFTGYIGRKYGSHFGEFRGGTIRATAARPIKSFYEVRATVTLRGEAPFDVIFLVSDRSGRNLFFDLYVEGVSLLKSERTEIGAMIDRRGGDIDAMIADLDKAG